MKKLMCNTISILGFLILSLIFIQGLFTDVRITDYEQIFFVGSNKYIVIVGMLVMIGLFGLWHKHIHCTLSFLKKLLILVMSANFLFVLCGQIYPGADQRMVLQTATEMCMGDYRGFLEGNYLHMYTNQRGLVLFCYFLCKLFGGFNFIVFQMLNVTAVNLIYYLIYRFFGGGVKVEVMNHKMKGLTKL